MKAEIAAFVRKCLTCAMVKTEYQKSSRLLTQLEIHRWKWQRITMYFITKLPNIPSGEDTIWVIVDRLTKSAHFLPIKETEKLTRIYIQEIVKLNFAILAVITRSHGYSS